MRLIAQRLREISVKGGMSENGWCILFIWFIWFGWLNETNQMNKTNQMNQINPRAAR